MAQPRADPLKSYLLDGRHEEVEIQSNQLRADIKELPEKYRDLWILDTNWGEGSMQKKTNVIKILSSAACIEA